MVSKSLLLIFIFFLLKERQVDMREMTMDKIKDLKCDVCGSRNKRIRNYEFTKDEVKREVICCGCGKKLVMEPKGELAKKNCFPKKYDICHMTRACDKRECIYHPEHNEFLAESMNKRYDGLPVYKPSDFSSSVQLRINDEKRFK